MQESKPLTFQEAFDKVVDCLADQGGPSIDLSTGTPSCRYRGPDGRRCAVGCVLPDDKYDSSFEGVRVSNIFVARSLVGVIEEIGGGLAYANQRGVIFMSNLQDAHDLSLFEKMTLTWGDPWRSQLDTHGGSGGVVREDGVAVNLTRVADHHGLDSARVSARWSR